MIGSGAFESGFVAAAHDGQLPVLRTGLTARDRGVDEGRSLLRCAGMKIARQAGAGRGVINDDHALLNCRLKRVIDRPHVRIITEAKKHILRPGNRLCRRRCRGSGMIGGPGVGLRGGAVPDRHIMPGGLQVPRHWVAHHAKTQKSGFRHYNYSYLCSGYGSDKFHLNPTRHSQSIFTLMPYERSLDQKGLLGNVWLMLIHPGA